MVACYLTYSILLPGTASSGCSSAFPASLLRVQFPPRVPVDSSAPCPSIPHERPPSSSNGSFPPESLGTPENSPSYSWHFVPQTPSNQNSKVMLFSSFTKL